MSFNCNKRVFAIACDHLGFNLKEAIKKHFAEKDYAVVDFGCHNESPADFPVLAKRLAKQISTGKYQAGILICGNGIGMSIAANRISQIRAALAVNTQMAIQARQHLDANMLCLGAESVSTDQAIEIIDAFFATEFSQEKTYARRIRMIED